MSNSIGASNFRAFCLACFYKLFPSTITANRIMVTFRQKVHSTCPRLLLVCVALTSGSLFEENDDVKIWRLRFYGNSS